MPHTVDLYLYATHEVPTWLPIASRLRDRGVDARFVLEPPEWNLARGSAPDPFHGWQDDKRSHMRPLVDTPTFDRLREVLGDVGEEPLTRLRLSASAAVTSAGAGWLRPWAGARIRCMYGVGLVRDAWGHGEINRGMDLVLCPGPFSAREIRRRCPGVPVSEVGYPKWARHRLHAPTRAQSRGGLGLSLDPQRPLVVWLPTWADHSSLDRYGSAFSSLAEHHDVVIKPHHNSVRFESRRLDALASAHPNIKVVATSTDLRDLVGAADVVVSDVRSGGLTEALLGDRPAVALEDGSVAADVIHPAGVGAVEMCDDPSHLSVAVAAARRDAGCDARSALVEDLFGPGGGGDDERAAEAIMDTIERVGRPWSRRATAPMWLAAYRVARRSGR